MATKVFISHASADQQLVSMFVEEILVSGMGFKPEDIFYSSNEDMGVENGKDIPEAIRTGLQEAKVFMMMVSDNYRRSEVCLNEMGAAWIRDDLLRIILLLPGTGFDRMGWLVSLKKGTKLMDPKGLDRLYDQITEALRIPRKTATWNQHKDVFIASIEDKVNGEEPDDEESCLLDDRDIFDEGVSEYTRVLHAITAAIRVYKTDMEMMNRRLNRVKENSRTPSTQQVRGILHQGAVDTNSLANVIEENTPVLQENFTKAMDAGIRMHQCEFIDEAVKENNRNRCGELVDAMTNAKSSFTFFRESLIKIVDLDKDFKRAKRRLSAVLDGLLAAISSCISKAEEYRVL